MQFVSERNIARVSFLYAIIVVGILIFSTGALFIIQKINTLDADITELEESFLKDEKENLKADVNGLIAFINSTRNVANERLKQQLKKRTEEALAITDNLYQTVRDEMDTASVITIIREAIRPIRFNNGRSYYFIFTLEGDSILHPINPAVEGFNPLKSTDPHLRSVGEKITTVAKERHKGYLPYDWPMPGKPQDELYQKLSYIVYYEPLKWIIGTGEYLVNLDNLAKTAITEDLRKNLQFYKDDYFFIYELHKIEGGKDFATMLINNNRKDLVGKTISDDYVDARGKAFRKEFLEDIRESGESFVEYWYKKPDGSGMGRKLTYFKLFPHWNWVVARGIYFDRLDAVVAHQKKNLADRVKKDILLLCGFFLLAVTISLMVAYHFSSQLQGIFDRYQKSQEESYAQLESLHQELKEQSRRDPLTRLYNRGHFNKRLVAIEMAKTERYGSPLGLILLDIDTFKMLNDTYGHLVGDQVLQSLAKLLGNNVRRTDVLARWGGEEFAILAPGLSIHDTSLFAEKLRKIIQAHVFPVDRYITCSFGIAGFVPREEGNSFLRRADEALYSAKQQGRNRCVAA